MAAIVRIIAVGLVLVGASLGCLRKFDYEGEWLGQRNLPTRGIDPSIAKTLGMVKLTIEGSRFELLEAGIPKGGSVRYTPDRAFLTVDTYMGRPIGEAGQGVQEHNVELELTPSGDAILFFDPRGFDAAPLPLRRPIREE